MAMKRRWLVAVVLVLVAQMAIGWLDPWKSPLGKWPPPAVVVVLLLVVLGVDAAKTRRERRLRATPPSRVEPPS